VPKHRKSTPTTSRGTRSTGCCDAFPPDEDDDVNQAQMMQQLRKMQQEMARVQEELANATVEGSAAGGVVTAAVNGEFRVTKLTIKPEAVDPADIETLEDLVVVAINDAIVKAKALSEQKMGKLTGGMKIPGLS
jgi:DNA-binding YbaB/EbfC family protein